MREDKFAPELSISIDRLFAASKKQRCFRFQSTKWC